MGNPISVSQLRNPPLQLVYLDLVIITLKNGRYNIHCKVQYSTFASFNSDNGRYVDTMKYFFREVNIKMRNYKKD
jgi:hypothetical protein